MNKSLIAEGMVEMRVKLPPKRLVNYCRTSDRKAKELKGLLQQGYWDTPCVQDETAEPADTERRWAPEQERFTIEH